VAWARHELGLLALRRGPDVLARAEKLLLDSLARHRELGDRWRTASVLDDLASAALLGGRPQRAAALLGAATAIRDDIGTVVAPCERPDHDTVEGRARELLGADAFSAEWTRGRDSTIDDVLAAPEAPRLALPEQRQPVRETTRVAERPTPTGRLRLRMLGAATVHLGDRRLNAADFGYGKPRELLWLLASTPQRTKDQIGLALWPDLAGGQLRNAFHTALRDLRRALGDPGWVVFNAGAYALDRSRDQSTDLQEFEASLAAARRARPAPDALPHLQRAIAAYGGDLLPEVVDVDWVDTRRGELRRVFSAALGAAGRLLATSGRYAEAAEVYRTAIEHDPLEESAHRHLMSCLIRLGGPSTSRCSAGCSPHWPSARPGTGCTTWRCSRWSSSAPIPRPGSRSPPRPGSSRSSSAGRSAAWWPTAATGGA
jgi:DNA-binding SARP family transcriptional activator